MRYISLATWRDLSDGHLYAEGDLFPFDGREISGDRLAELESDTNRAGLKLIRADEADAGRKDEKGPEGASEGREKATETKPKTTAKPKSTRTKKKE